VFLHQTARFMDPSFAARERIDARLAGDLILANDKASS
jgi:hypothetical protein